MVDTQRLVIEEAPDMLSGGAQPKRINVFVSEKRHKYHDCKFAVDEGY